jgi:hypothetical protein
MSHFHTRLGVEVLEDRQLLAAGVLDSTFGAAGVAVTDLGGERTALPRPG